MIHAHIQKLPTVYLVGILGAVILSLLLAYWIITNEPRK